MQKSNSLQWTLPVALAFVVAVASGGCSISNSIESSSDSLTNSSDSSSNSSESSSNSSKKDDGDKSEKADSGTDAADAASASYQADARDYTAAYMRGLEAGSGTMPTIDVDAFRIGLSQVAAEYGMTNWQGDAATYTGIGLGLAKADVTPEQFTSYSTALSGGDAAKAASIKQGYDQGR